MVTNVSFDLAAGEALVLLGHNGVGKSTLLKTIAAELTPVSGTVALDGESYPQAGRVHEIGFAPQSIALLPRLTVEQNLRTFGAVLNLTGDALQAQIEHTLKTVALFKRRGQRVETLSGGLQRRVNIAASLMGMPKVLLLDEPQVGVDQEGRETLVETLRALLAYGTTLILITHDLDFARSLATRVGVLAAGGMAMEGAPSEIIERTFADKQLVSIRFEDSPDSGASETSSAEAAQSVLAQFKRAPDGTYEAVTQLPSGALDALLEELASHGLVVAEVRVVKPGLAQLLDLHAEQRT